MIRLPRELCKEVPFSVPAMLKGEPLQVGGDPWHVALASMLLCRTRRVQAEPVYRQLLSRWPDPVSLARAEGVEEVVRPCGLHRSRARHIQRFSTEWLGDWWSDMRELSGVGIYVTDCIGLFCFGCTELECTDSVLLEYASHVRLY